MRYCIGDIHGCIKTFKELMRQIFTESKYPDIYIVGDLIDRGPNSRAVLDFIIDLINKGIKINSVRGNHEEMLLFSYKNNYKITDTNWYLNGAEATIRSFIPQADLNLKVKELIPNKHYQFLLTMPYFIELEDYIIVHAGLNFNTKNPFIDFESMLWTREEQNNSQITKGKKIIHGHTPIPFVQIKSRVLSMNTSIINIDSGCVYAQSPKLGSLTAMNLDTNNLFNVKNVEVKF